MNIPTAWTSQTMFSASHIWSHFQTQTGSPVGNTGSNLCWSCLGMGSVFSETTGKTPSRQQWHWAHTHSFSDNLWWLNQHISLIGRIHVLATKISCYTAAALALHTLLSTGDVLGWTFFAHSLVWPAYQAGRGSPTWPQSRLSITNSNAIQSRLVTLLQRCFQFLQESQQLKGPESSTRTRHANKFLRSWIFLKPENRHWASFQTTF